MYLFFIKKSFEMEPENELPNLSSQEAMETDVDEMDDIRCNKVRHKETLSKLCEDEECDEKNEQFELECAACEEKITHKKKNHKTKRVKTVMNEVIDSTYDEEKKQKNKKKGGDNTSALIKELMDLVDGKIYQIQKGK